MKKRIIALLLCFITLFSLVSCGEKLPEGLEIPEGMQLAGGEAQGFYLFVPEEWTLSSQDGVIGAYFSTLDHSSVSLARVHPEAGETIDGYFKRTMEDMPFEGYKLEKEGVALKLGNIAKAYAYEYTFDYPAYGKETAQKQHALQVIGAYKERTFVFTYTASDEIKANEKTYYQTHIEAVNEMINAIVFTEPKPITAEDPSYEKDADGYFLAAKKRSCGFNLYVHPDWECTISSGIAEATAKDGSSFNLGEARDTGVVVSDYFKKRISDLERYTDGKITVIYENKETAFGNADQALAYEYTYTFRGEAYHTYQVIMVHEKIPFFLKKGYVFTFTATEDNYADRIEEVKRMIAKVTL